MKKSRFSIVVIALSLILLLAGCDGSITETLKKGMDPFHENNIYVNSGLIKPSTAGMDGVKESMKTETVTKEEIKESTNEKGQVEIGSDTKGFGEVIDALKEVTGDENFKVVIQDEELNNVIKENGILAPQTKEQQQALKDSINKINSSPTESKNFSTEMAKESTTEQSNAAKGTLAVAASAIDSITGSDKLNDDQKAVLNDLKTTLVEKAKTEGTLTQGEVLQAQMVTNLISSSAGAITSIANSNGNIDVTDEKISTFVDDSIAVINASKALAGGALIDITDLLGSLAPMLGTQSGTPAAASNRAVSRDGDTEPTFYDKLLSTGKATIPSDLSSYGDLSTPEGKADAEANRKQAFASFTMMKNLGRALFAVADDGSFNSTLARVRIDASAQIFKYYQNMVVVLGLDKGENKELTDFVASKFSGVATSSLFDAVFGFTASQLSTASKQFIGNANAYLDIVGALIADNKAYATKAYEFKGGETISFRQSSLDTLITAGLIPSSNDGYTDEQSEEIKAKFIEYYCGEEDAANGTYKGTDAFNSAFSTFDGMLNAVGLDNLMKFVNDMMNGTGGSVESTDFTSFKKMYQDSLKSIYEGEHSQPEANV